ncbi:GNAT family N-acetyltransferase [Cellulomonas sp. H30R-01]|uniref:GNAT family N-acetyltransferase n=1 Tax=Cellulomonas sp. H30R-01 TaxID=2704467 RepID=UPI00138C71FA|nr:GNAT family N-acetyltransferase [Cellulomonas sp. H30R-01]QHT55854.1 GNAT family N-acetyltransferase [Cellulomonas sp. H30R-01]
MSALLTRLPARWRAHRALLGGDGRWDDAHVVGDDDGVLLAASSDAGPSLFGLGDVRRVGALLDAEVAHPEAGSLLDRTGFVDRARWLTVPRGTTPSARVLAALRLAPFSTWDWLAADAVPAAWAADPRVVRLDPLVDAAAIRACLAVANPGTSADPTHPGEAGWWGVRGGDGLVGVVGASLRGGGPGRAPSWHLHGLGVRPEARGRGVGTALTATVLADGLAAGCAFVSLGMYADNERARGVYERLGFRTGLECASFGPRGADRPAP